MTDVGSAKVFKVVAIVFAAALAMAALLVPIALFGAYVGWWGVADTEMGMPAHVATSMPGREAFSSETAWEDWLANWRDPYWNGEHPKGYRYIVASYRGTRIGEDERADRGGANAFVAGCVRWRFIDGAKDGEAASLAELVGAGESYLLHEEAIRSEDEEGRTVQYFLLYFDELTDVYAKAKEVSEMAEASEHDYHGNSDWVRLDDVFLPFPEMDYPDTSW